MEEQLREKGLSIRRAHRARDILDVAAALAVLVGLLIT